PDAPITSLILPPRKKETVQLPPRKASIITPSSLIITLQHAAEISSWIDRRTTTYDTAEIPYEFKLLLRGSKDGFTDEVLHRLRDNIP
ncbi:11128_t:CDS:1, partial [Gigaspora rosea]